MPSDVVGDLWWKNAVIYCLDVETFADSNGDGVGDFGGLTERMDYLAGLGVTCLWLMPFYPSDQRDDGYDVTDYYSVDPRLGNLGDFTQCVRTASAHGLKVIVDLVVNHTSREHPWFQEARSDPGSPFRAFYVWRDEPPADWKPILIFPGEQETNWTYDEEAGQYYLHHFYPHQPDLNIQEPVVRDEIAQIVGFWMEQGVAGFRMDAVPYMVDMQGAAIEEAVTPHGMLRDLRAFMVRRRGDSVLLGEANLEPYELVEYLEGEDELQLALNFYLNQHVFLALARRDPDPIRKALTVLPPIPTTAQWGNFLKNHDELSLDKLTTDERAEVFEAFGPATDMQLYGRGIRRRVPPMLEGEPSLIRLAYSLTFALPGSPILFYGEEIGMGENLAVDGRLAVRTPMQWVSAPHGGFSRAPIEAFVRPMPTGESGPERVSVASQQQDPDSLLSWTQRLIRRRRETPELGMGKVTTFDCGAGDVLAYQVQWRDRRLVILHNFGGRARRVDISTAMTNEFVERRDIWSDRRYEPEEPASARIARHGYRWIRMIERGQETLL